MGIFSQIAKQINNDNEMDIIYTLHGIDYDVRFMPKDVANGINITSIIAIPRIKNMQNRIVLEANNMETDDMENLLDQSTDTAKRLVNLTKDNPCPILIPILPSEENGPYFQQLSRECFDLSPSDPNYRIDEQVVKVLEKAKEILSRDYCVQAEDKVFLNGYSSSGVFAQRFAMIHPEVVDTLCVGGASGSIPVPTTKLDYPIGIGDFSKLFGKDFYMNKYKDIKMRYYVGEHETMRKTHDRFDENGNPASMHDMSYFDRSVPNNVGKAQRHLLGEEMFIRAKKSVATLRKIGIDIKHSIVRRKIS